MIFGTSLWRLIATDVHKAGLCLWFLAVFSLEIAAQWNDRSDETLQKRSMDLLMIMFVLPFGVFFTGWCADRIVLVDRRLHG